jgi:hypothetical protein
VANGKTAGQHAASVRRLVAPPPEPALPPVQVIVVSKTPAELPSAPGPSSSEPLPPEPSASLPTTVVLLGLEAPSLLFTAAAAELNTVTAGSTVIGPVGAIGVPVVRIATAPAGARDFTVLAGAGDTDELDGSDVQPDQGMDALDLVFSSPDMLESLSVVR